MASSEKLIEPHQIEKTSCKWFQLRVKIERLSNYTDIGKRLLPLGPWPSIISVSYA